jgi:hypothetical protein
MRAESSGSILLERREGSDSNSDGRRGALPSTMDSREEELELVTLFRLDEERRQVVAAMDSWLREEGR